MSPNFTAFSSSLFPTKYTAKFSAKQPTIISAYKQSNYSAYSATNSYPNGAAIYATKCFALSATLITTIADSLIPTNICPQFSTIYISYRATFRSTNVFTFNIAHFTTIFLAD